MMSSYFLCEDYLETVWEDLSIIRNRPRHFLCIRKVLRKSEVAHIIRRKSNVNLQMTSF